jgi:Tfp pilus assembly protein PilO
MVFVLFGIVPPKQFLPFHLLTGGGMYRFEAKSVEGLIQQIAVSYIVNGYWFYVVGQVPEHKSVEAVDRKLMSRYGVRCSKYVRARRKRKGLANVQYIRYGRFFVLLATEGRHHFFDEEPTICDFRKTTLHYGGYSVRCWTGDGKSRPSVRIGRETYRELKAYFEANAIRDTAENLERDFRSLTIARYGPIKRQLKGLLRHVNRMRKSAGMELLFENSVSSKRIHRSPFRVRRADIEQAKTG